MSTTAPDQTCPKCRRLSPPNALTCECGHSFANPPPAPATHPDREAARRQRWTYARMIFAMMAAMPGIYAFMGRPATGPAQAIFRIAVILVGIVGVIVTSICLARMK